MSGDQSLGPLRSAWSTVSISPTAISAPQTGRRSIPYSQLSAKATRVVKQGSARREASWRGRGPKPERATLDARAPKRLLLAGHGESDAGEASVDEAGPVLNSAQTMPEGTHQVSGAGEGGVDMTALTPATGMSGEAPATLDHSGSRPGTGTATSHRAVHPRPVVSSRVRDR